MEHKPILGHPAPCNAQKSPCHCRLEDGDKQDVWEKGELGNTCSVPCFFPPTADTGAVRGVLLKIEEKHTHRFEGREYKDVQDTHTHICYLFLLCLFHHKPAQGDSQAEVNSSHSLSPVLALEKVWEGGAGVQSVHSYSPCQALGHNDPMDCSRLENCPVEKDLEVLLEHEPK